MAEILHSQLADVLNKDSGDPLPGVFLIHGQEMLVEQAAETLVVKLLDGASRDLCCETVEGLVEKTTDVLAQMNTFSMMPEPKIVIFKEAKLFEGSGSHQRLAEQIIDASENEDLDLAAKSLLTLCRHLEIDLQEVLHVFSASEPIQLLHDHLSSDGLDKVVQFAISRGLRPTGGDNYMETLLAAIEKGFADHHHLIITVNAKVPKNLKFYKATRDHGWVIDCNVPMGERRADRMAQEGVLRKTLETALADAGKRLQAGLFETLCQLTGFDLRTFVQNIEKLIDYTGERTEITTEDVHKVLRRTKSDPIFELTNAVADRNLNQALFYLHTLLEADWYPLQILAALANQIRRLVIAKDFSMSSQGKSWTAGMGYPQFQSAVMPAIISFDRQIRDISIAWQPSSEETKKSKSGGPKAGQDIALAPNPNNPYPVYQTLLKSEKYTQQELLRALVLLNQTDLRLKSTGQDASMVLNKTVMDICKSHRY
jgi:DNA polymerase-3 subunit delta